MKPLVNNINKVFGQLKVTHCVELSDGKNSGGKWMCMCKCRRMITLTGYQLHSRKSCGCLGKKHREQMGKNNRKSDKDKMITKLYQKYKRDSVNPLTKEQWLIAMSRYCEYCKSTSTEVFGDIPLCSTCRKMKGLLSDEEFIEHVSKIYENKKPA